jgi:hypothetical protein
MVREIPQTREEGARWAILEWPFNASFETPVCASPYFDTSVVGLRREELPNWVPANALDKTLMEVKVSH